MTETIEQLAQRVAKAIFDDEVVQSSNRDLAEFLKLGLSEWVKQQEPVAYVDVKDSYEGPYKFEGMKLLSVGKHYLYTPLAIPQPMPEGGSIECLVNDIKSKDKIISELLAKKFVRFNNEDCWIYQGDGEDHLESLICPVVISPHELMKLISAASAVQAQNEDLVSEIEKLRDVLLHIRALPQHRAAMKLAQHYAEQAMGEPHHG